MKTEDIPRLKLTDEELNLIEQLHWLHAVEYWNTFDGVLLHGRLLQQVLECII